MQDGEEGGGGDGDGGGGGEKNNILRIRGAGWRWMAGGGGEEGFMQNPSPGGSDIQMRALKTT